MAKNPKKGKLIYHLTALDNLESIFKNGLLPRKKIKFDFKNVAEKEILQVRKKYDLEDYIPFHFFCPTPFAGAAQIANKKTEFIYITINRTNAESNNFKIIPSHPLNYQKKPLKWKKGIEKINWDLIANSGQTIPLIPV